MTRRAVLLDENISVQLRHRLPSVDAETVEYRGWKGVRNGDLVGLAIGAGYLVLVTADARLAKTPRLWAPLGCVFVTRNTWPRLRAAATDIDLACARVLPGQVLTVRL